MWYIILGHILGDYFLQSKKMALSKTKDHSACFVHCMLYAAVMFICCWPITSGQMQTELLVLWYCWIFITHYLTDHWSLGQIWLILIKGRNLAKTHDDYDRIFSAIVYVVVDNTLHIIYAVGFLRLFTSVLDKYF